MRKPAEQSFSSPKNVDSLIQKWLADTDMSWMPAHDEVHFTRVPAHSLPQPRRALNDLSNNLPSPSLPLQKPEPPTQASNSQSQIAPLPIKTFSKKKPRGEKKTLKLKSNQRPGKEEDILESVEGKCFSILIAQLFSTHDASMSDNVPTNQTVSDKMLNDLWTETAKLKASGSLSRVPADFLSRLVQLMDTYVREGSKAPEEALEQNASDTSIAHGFYASLVIINIFTAPNVEKTLIIEEVVDNMLQFVKFHMAHSIMPAFDPLRDTTNIRVEKNKRLVGLLCSYLNVLNQFIATQQLTDGMVLGICTFTIPTFFMEGTELQLRALRGSELQLNALNVVRTIFSRYQNHRALILEEIFTSLAKLPKTKRALRTFCLPEVDNVTIQMLSALVLQLIQCCPSIGKLPLTESKKVDLDLPAQGNAETEGRNNDPNSYAAAVACAHSFMNSFVAKCSTREEDNDYRQILSNFVEDLLTTINLPEWPASQVLLRVLSVILLKNIKKNSKENTVLKSFSIELLGSIAAKVKKEMTLAQKWRQILPSSSHVDTDETVACICNVTYDDGAFMLQCDECHKWLHGACVGVLPCNVPATWLCDSCLIRTRVKARKHDTHQSPNISLNESNDEGDRSADLSSEVDESHEIDVMRFMLLNYLAECSKQNPSLNFSRQFYISQWCHRDTDEDRVEDFKSQWDISSKRSVEIAERNERLITRDGVMKIVRFLSTKSPLFLGYDVMLRQILSLMGEPVITFRQKGLKALAAILEADPSTLADPHVEQAVMGRFIDNAKSVRSAVVDLVGKYILERVDFASQYYREIAKRIMDSGVSVRKRAVKILSDVCLAKSDHSLIPTICKEILKRIEDEDESIRDIVLKTFHNLWFSPLPHNSTKYPDQATSAKASSINVRVDQLIDVLAEGSGQWFVDLAKNLLRQGPNESKRIHSICVSLVSCVVERLLAGDELTAQEQAKKLPSTLHTLHLLCQASPDLLIPHITTLQPYMKLTNPNDPNEQITAKNVIQIVEIVAPLIEHPDPLFLPSVEQDLKTLICKISLTQSCSWSALAVAVKCLSTLVQRLTNNHQLMLSIVDLFCKYLFNCRSMCKYKKELTDSRVAHASRALYCLGHICRHYTGTANSSKDPILDSTFDLFTEYAQSISSYLQLKAIQALGSVYMRVPQLMLKPHAQDIIRNGLASESEEIRLQTLCNISEFLASEEQKTVAMASKSQKSSSKPGKLDETDLNESLDVSSHKLFIEMDKNDSGVSNAIAQLFLDPILELCLDCQRSVRLAALGTLEHIQHQGLVHPMQCVRYLIALETDRISFIADRAHGLLIKINQKYPNFLHNRLGEGIKLSYMFQKKTWNSCSVLDHRAMLAPLYTLFSEKRTTRNLFINALFQLLNLSTSIDTDFFQYLAELILSLPYTYINEVLLIIYHINRIISLMGENTLSALCKFFKNAKARATSEGMAFPKDKLEISSSVMVLLILKHSLKRMYKITDSRCKAFTPTDAVKSREGRITDPPVNSFSTDIASFKAIPRQFNHEDMPGLRQHYKKFKQMIHEDAGDFEFKEKINVRRGRGRPRKRAKGLEEEITPEGHVECVAENTKLDKSEESESSDDASSRPRKKAASRKRGGKRKRHEEDSNDSDFVD